jgi:tripartite-type tricarboxylate transporter receptor subunit TctC
MPSNKVQELLAIAKKKPGTLNSRSSSVGGGGHLAGELFTSMGGVE